MEWAGYLTAGATISTSTWTLQTGITRVDDDIDGSTTTVLISGGTHGTNYTCTNTITTSAGETLERTGIVRVRTL
jgi:hypothetical protein